MSHSLEFPLKPPPLGRLLFAAVPSLTPLSYHKIRRHSANVARNAENKKRTNFQVGNFSVFVVFCFPTAAHQTKPPPLGDQCHQGKRGGLQTSASLAEGGEQRSGGGCGEGRNWQFIRSQLRRYVFADDNPTICSILPPTHPQSASLTAPSERGPEIDWVSAYLLT